MPCMNDISDRSFDMDMDLKEFHLFPKLCADLRIMIWKLAVEQAINQPRFLQIYPCYYRSNHNCCLPSASADRTALQACPNYFVPARHHIRRPSQISPIYSLLLTDHESAHEVRKAWNSNFISCSYPTHPLRPRHVEAAFFNPDLDTLALPYNALRPIITPYCRTTFTGLGRVKRLLLLQTRGFALHCLYQPRELARDLARFGPLRELFIENSNYPREGFVKALKTFERVERRNRYSFSPEYYPGNADRSMAEIKDEMRILGVEEIERIVVVGVVKE